MNCIPLRAGRVDITPPSALPLFGRLDRTASAVAVASRLEANCLLITSSEEKGHAALITIDSLYPSQTLVDSISELCVAHGLEIRPDSIMIVASHTHNAPALDETKPKLGVFAPNYLAFVADQIAACLVSLVQEKAVQITNFSHGRAQSPASVYRRRWVAGFDFKQLRFSRRMLMAPDPLKNVDNALTMVALTDDDENTHAVIWSWPCHAVSEPNALAVSADFPGAVRAHIRASLGDTSLAVLYFPGFSGDIRPASRSRLPIHKIGRWIGLGARFARPNQRRVEMMHTDLFAAFDRARAESRYYDHPVDMVFTHCRRSLSLDDIRTEAGRLAPITCDDWRIGPLRIKAVSAEVAADYSYDRGSADTTTFLTGCSGQVFGYLPTDSQLPFGGYEVEGFASAFSVPGYFHGEIEAKVSELIGT